MTERSAEQAPVQTRPDRRTPRGSPGRATPASDQRGQRRAPRHRSAPRESSACCRRCRPSWCSSARSSGPRQQPEPQPVGPGRPDAAAPERRPGGSAAGPPGRDRAPTPPGPSRAPASRPAAAEPHRPVVGDEDVVPALDRLRHRHRGRRCSWSGRCSAPPASGTRSTTPSSDIARRRATSRRSTSRTTSASSRVLGFTMLVVGHRRRPDHRDRDARRVPLQHGRLAARRHRGHPRRGRALSPPTAIRLRRSRRCGNVPHRSPASRAAAPVARPTPGL